MKRAICKIRFYFCIITEHSMGMWTLPDPEHQWFLCHSPPWKCLPLSAPSEICHLSCFFISSQTSLSSSSKPSLSSCSKRWCVCSARRMPRGPPFIALCRLFYLSDRHPPVLFQVIRVLLQITLLPVWGSDPSQGSPLNLILIITSVINKRGLGRDYSTRPIPLFPTVDRALCPTLSCHPGLSPY